MIPDLWRVRRVMFPTLDRVVPERIYGAFVSHTLPREYAGVWDSSPKQIRQQLRERPDTYPDNVAAQRVTTDGHALADHAIVTPLYACGSYAYRPDGFFGRWQLHVRLYATTDRRTAAFVHWEQNPYVTPHEHLNNIWFDTLVGVERARARYDLNSVPLDQLTFTNEP